MDYSLAAKWIFRRISYTLWLVITDLINSDSDVLEHLIELLSEVTECDGTVVREVLFDEHVAVEASHFRDCEDTDSTERACLNWQYLTLCDVCTEDVVRC